MHIRKVAVMNIVLALSLILVAAQCAPAPTPEKEVVEVVKTVEVVVEKEVIVEKEVVVIETVEVVVEKEVIVEKEVEVIKTVEVEVEKEAAPAEAPDTLVVLTASTPPALDVDLWGGKSWERVLANVYDSVLDYEMVSEAEVGIPTGTDVAGVAKINGIGDDGIVGSFFESWEISEDGATVTFHVREGLKSYWGNQATADDWIWRVERAFALADVGDFQLRVIGITGPEDVKKIDDMTVEMNMPKGANPVFFKGLCVPVLVGVDVDVMREDGWLTEDDPWGLEAMKHNDFGFGAYHTVEFVPGSHLSLEANPYYWKPLQFQKVFYREVPESSVRLALLMAGEAHLSDELTLVQKASTIGGSGEARYVGMPENSTWFVIYTNREWGAFQADECYQAMGYAVPYEEVQRTAFFNFGRIASEVAAPMFGETVNSEDWPYKYDLDKAKELWEAGSCPASFEMAWDASYPEQEDVAILIKTEFNKIGVDVVLDRTPTAAFAAKRGDFTLESFIEESAAFVADAGYAAWLNWHKDSFGNHMQYYNDETSQMIDDSMTMPSGPERNELLFEIQRELINRGGRIGMLWTGWHVVANKHLEGFYWYSVSLVKWRDLYWVE